MFLVLFYSWAHPERLASQILIRVFDKPRIEIEFNSDKNKKSVGRLIIALSPTNIKKLGQSRCLQQNSQRLYWSARVSGINSPDT